MESLKKARVLEMESSEPEDRISSLPDSLLHDILSSLGTEQVVQTCVVAKRWKDLWKSIPNLRFNQSLWNTTSSDPHRFMTFVERVLALQDNCNLDLFHLDIACDVDRLITWLIIAAKRNVKSMLLCIDLYQQKIMLLPSDIFTTGIVNFSLYVCLEETILLPTSVCSAAQLKTLELGGVHLPYFKDNTLVLSCPTLQVFTMMECRHGELKTIDICAPQLKHLKIQNHRFYDKFSCKINISTPRLVSIKLKGNVYKYCCVKKLLSLATAVISLTRSPEYTQHTVDLLQHFYHATTLKLSGWSPPPQDEQIYNPLLNVTCLKLIRWGKDSSSTAIRNLLKSSPFIECLVLDEDLAQKTGDWGEELFQMIFSGLKDAEIHDLTGCSKGLRFLELLLRNAVVLERVTIFSLIKGKELETVRVKIKSLRRASLNVKVYLKSPRL